MLTLVDKERIDEFIAQMVPLNEKEKQLMVYSAISGCQRCSLLTQCLGPVPPQSPTIKIYPRIMVVGRNPGNVEDSEKVPFVGPGGKLLNELLQVARIDRRALYVTNLTKCYTQSDVEPDHAYVRSCAIWLNIEVQIFKPDIIIPLGNQAVRCVINNQKVSVTRIRKQSFKLASYFGGETLVIPLYHPGFALRRNSARFEMTEDLVWLGEKIRAHMPESLVLLPKLDDSPITRISL